MKYLAFDTRALALMRMAIASVIMFDLAIRLCDLEAFYTNMGAVPLGMVFNHSWNQYFVSLHAISGLWIVQFLLFLFSFFCSVMLFIGYRTRLFTVFSWVMLVSLHNRNLLILQGGDDLLRLVLFWAMFIPWGRRYSCDNILSSHKNENQQIISIATLAYLLQICYIYTGSALLKGSEWNQDFTALYYAYSLDQIAFPFSKLIYYYPELLTKLTAFVYYFELLVPLLFFMPFQHSLCRIFAVVSIITFHFINSISLLIGLFPLIGIATVLGILPAQVFDKAESILEGMVSTVRASFLHYAELTKRLMKWKEPQELNNPILKSILSASLVFLIVFVFDWNFSNLSFVKSRLSDELRFIGYGLRLDQSWGMFAPGVFKDDGWYILKGEKKGGGAINLAQGGIDVSYAKPAYIVNMFKNDRWRKYSENYIFADNEYMRGYFCNYYLRVWNESHPQQQIVSLSVIYMKEFTLPDYHYSKPEQNILCSCSN